MSEVTLSIKPSRPEGIDLRGVRFDRVTEAQAVDYVIQALAPAGQATASEDGQGPCPRDGDDLGHGVGRGGWVMTSNLDHLLRAGRDAEFRGMLEEADLVVADGAPLVWASRLQGTALPERVAGSSLVWTLSEAAATRGLSVFLLGGDAGTAEAAGQILARRYPGLRIAGTHCPPMGFEKDPAEIHAIVGRLRASGADLVYVALGSPKQEQLIRRLRRENPDLLPGAWWMGVGISLSFICGQVQRAPVWVQKLGLEWGHRLVQEPRRLARRYLIDGIPFAAVLLGGSVGRRLGSNPNRWRVGAAIHDPPAN